MKLLILFSLFCTSLTITMQPTPKLQAIIEKKQNAGEFLTDSEALLLVAYYNEKLKKGIVPVNPSCASNESGTTKKPRKKKAHCSVQ